MARLPRHRPRLAAGGRSKQWVCLLGSGGRAAELPSAAERCRLAALRGGSATAASASPPFPAAASAGCHPSGGARAHGGGVSAEQGAMACRQAWAAGRPCFQRGQPLALPTATCQLAGAGPAAHPPHPQPTAPSPDLSTGSSRHHGAAARARRRRIAALRPRPAGAPPLLATGRLVAGMAAAFGGCRPACDSPCVSGTALQPAACMAASCRHQKTHLSKTLNTRAPLLADRGATTWLPSAAPQHRCP